MGSDRLISSHHDALYLFSQTFISFVMPTIHIKAKTYADSCVILWKFIGIGKKDNKSILKLTSEMLVATLIGVFLTRLHAIAIIFTGIGVSVISLLIVTTLTC